MITTMILLFVVGYLFIALEHKTKIDKSAVALLMAGAIWTVFSLLGNDPKIQHELVDEESRTASLDDQVGDPSGRQAEEQIP